MEYELDTDPRLLKLIGGSLLVTILAAAVIYQVRYRDPLPETYRAALGPSELSDSGPGMSWCRYLSDGEATAFGAFDFVNPGPDDLVVESVRWNAELVDKGGSAGVTVESWVMTTSDHDFVLPTGVMSLQDIALSPEVMPGWELRTEVPARVPSNWRAGIVLLVQHPAGTSVVVRDVEMTIEVSGAEGIVASSVTIESGSVCQ